MHLRIPEEYRTTFAIAWDQRRTVLLTGELARDGKHLALKTVEQAALTNPDPDDI